MSIFSQLTIYSCDEEIFDLILEKKFTENVTITRIWVYL